MADFLLTVGVDTALSFDQMQKDISKLITDIQSTTPKIKVGLELDTSAVSNLQKQIASIQDLINKSGGSGRDGRNSAASFQSVMDNYAKMQKLLNDNTNSTGSSAWNALSSQANNFARVIDLVNEKNITVKQALKELGIDGSRFIDNARLAMSTFRAELEQTGLKGGTNLSDIRTALLEMQTLLDNNSGSSGLKSFEGLQSTANQFAEAVRLITTEGMSVGDALTRVGLNGVNAMSSATGAVSEFKKELKSTSSIEPFSQQYYTSVKQVDNLLGQISQNQSKWTAAKEGQTKEQYNKLEEYANRLAELKAKLDAGTISQAEFKKQFTEISDGVLNVNNAIKSANENTLSWSDRIKGLIAKFSTWFSITRVVMAAYRSIKKMVTNVIELDTAMTELKKVTNETDIAYEKFLVRATSRAKELGAALTDTVKATADFARLGFGIEDAEKLADSAIIYKNVGDGIENISDASESLIATMQAFDINAEDAMSIVDKFNEVGNNYAISSKGVGDALLRSAAAMHSANNTLDETIALATAANTVVQDPEKVGKCYAQQYSNVLKEDSYIG